MCSPNCPERSTCADMGNSEGNALRPVRSLGYCGNKGQKKVKTGSTMWLPAASLTREEDEEEEEPFDQWSC